MIDVRNVAMTLGRKAAALVVGLGLLGGGFLAIAPAMPAAAAPVGCNSNLYYIPNADPSQIIERTPAGVESVISTTLPGGGWSLALSPADGELYALSRTQSLGNHVYRVAADGTTTDLGGVAGLPANTLSAVFGFDDAGTLWAYYSNAGIFRIDLTTMTSTVIPGSASTLLRGDFAEVDGTMYASVTTSTNPLATFSLARVDLTTGAVEVVAVPGMIRPTSYWSVQDHLYMAQGTALYEVLGYNTPTPTLSHLADLPGAPADGASCPTAASPFLNAGDDDFTSSPLTASTAGATESVFANDTLNGAAFAAADVTATLTSDGGLTGATLGADGTISVPATASPGSYTVSYLICEVANPTICDPANVTISVAAATVPTSPATPPATPVGHAAVGGTKPELAATGSDALLPMGIAGALLAAGLALTIARRRRAGRLEN